MPFITQNNASQIIRKIEGSQIDAEYIATLGKPWFRKLYDLSLKEQQRLLLHKGFYHNPAPFVQYLKSNRKDTYTYIYESGKPSYHVDHACPKLTAPFHSPKIPDIVRKAENLEGEVVRFRAWFKNPDPRPPFYKNDPEREEALLTEIMNMQPEQAPNSGIQHINNYSLEELETKLDELHNKIESCIYDAAQFYQQCSSIEKMALNKYKVNSGIMFSSKPIYNNDTGMLDEVLKQFIRNYHEMFKNSVMNDLKEYYRIKFNPNLEFKGTLLEQLNFRSCSSCHAALLVP